eukprot:COSAG04_NODE_1124_length_8149_cov_4.403700_4_plen_312_part_00
MASADEWTEAYQEEWSSQEAREDAWTFDVQGWIHLPAALQHSEAGGGDLLLQQPRVLAKLQELAQGETRYRLDAPPREVQGQGQGWLNSLLPSDVRRLGYDLGVYPARRALIRGFRVLLVVEDEGSPVTPVALAPASHKAVLPPPTAGVVEEMGGVARPALRAGDVLIAAATTLAAHSPRGPDGSALVEVVLRFDPFADASATLRENIEGAGGPIAGAKGMLPAWFEEATPEQQAVMGPGFAPLRPEHDRLRAVESDGESVRLAPDDGEQPLLAADEEAIERWFFDTMGYLIVKQVMDRGETLTFSSFVRV